MASFLIELKLVMHTLYASAKVSCPKEIHTDTPVASTMLPILNFDKPWSDPYLSAPELTDLAKHCMNQSKFDKRPLASLFAIHTDHHKLSGQ